MKSMTKMFPAIVAALLILAAAPSRATGDAPTGEAAAQERGSPDSGAPAAPAMERVTGRIDTALTDPVKRKLLDDHDVLTVLVKEINTYFARHGGFPEGMTIEVVITNIRLRSGKTAAAAGVLAGRDRLVTEIVFMKDDKEVGRLKHKEANTASGLTYPPSRRVKLLAEETAEFIFKQSRYEPLALQGGSRAGK